MQQAPTRLHWIRTFHNLTLQELAALAGLSYPTVQNVEKRGVGSGASLAKIAKALGASPDTLLDRGWDLAGAVQREYEQASQASPEHGANETRKRVARDLQMLSSSR